MRLPAKEAATTLILNNSMVKVWQQDIGMASGTLSKNVNLQNKLATGIYFLVIQRNDMHYTKKILICK